MTKGRVAEGRTKTVSSRPGASGTASKSSPPPRPPDAAVDSHFLALYEKAIASFQKGDFETAAKKFDQVLATPGLEAFLADRCRTWADLCHRRNLGEAKPKSQEDPYTNAVFEKNRGEFEASLEILKKLLRRGGDEERIHHLAASVHALRGSRAEAIEHLEKALALNPDLAFQIRQDPDFASLRATTEFRRLSERHRRG